MSLTALEHKNHGNEHYSNHQSSLAIQSYTQAIQLIENDPQEDEEQTVPFYLLYSNRSAAHIQDKDFYCGYEDAKQSLQRKKDKNFKGFYRAAVCAYHLGFIEQSEELIKEATNDYQQNLVDYDDLKMLIEKKMKCIKRWRKPIATAKKCIRNLEQVIQKVIWLEIPATLYQIRYILRSYFDKSKDRKLMNMDHGDLGLRLHQLAIQFNGRFNVANLLMFDSIFEDLILNEMPDVGLSRLKAYEQHHLPEDEQDDHLEDEANQDLTAYEFSFFVNNVLASLVVNSSDETISRRALRQIHRLTTNDFYRRALGDALSDALNTYLYKNDEHSLLLDKFVSNNGIEILFHDYLESSCHLSASRMIKQITIDQWKRQSSRTIQFVLQQISHKIHFEDRQLIKYEHLSSSEIEFEQLSTYNSVNEHKEHLNIILNVLSKISMIFGSQPFLDRSLHDPLFVYVHQNWSTQFHNDQNKHDMPYLINGWTSILTQWLTLNYQDRQQYRLNKSIR